MVAWRSRIRDVFVTSLTRRGVGAPWGRVTPQEALLAARRQAPGAPLAGVTEAASLVEAVWFAQRAADQEAFEATCRAVARDESAEDAA